MTDNASAPEALPDKPIAYMTSWCPFCSQLRTGLAAAGIEFTEIDVDVDSEAAEFVESVNDGNRVVPTVLFSDGSTATNPPAEDVRDKVAALTQ